MPTAGVPQLGVCSGSTCRESATVQTPTPNGLIKFSECAAQAQANFLLGDRSDTIVSFLLGGGEEVSILFDCFFFFYFIFILAVMTGITTMRFFSFLFKNQSGSFVRN